MPVKVIPDSLDTGRGARFGWRAGLALVLLLAVFGLWWSLGTDARVLSRMEPVERARLFDVTRRNAEAICATRGFEDRCRAAVELLGKFPECGTECQAFVARNRPRASR